VSESVSATKKTGQGPVRCVIPSDGKVADQEDQRSNSHEAGFAAFCNEIHHSGVHVFAEFHVTACDFAQCSNGWFVVTIDDRA
jgi:hypothetical protein